MNKAQKWASQPAKYNVCMWAPMCTIQWICAVIMYDCNHWADQTAVCFATRSSSFCFSSTAAAAPCACHPKCDNFQLCIYELNTVWFIKYSTHACYDFFPLHNLLQLRFHLTKVFVIHAAFHFDRFFIGGFRPNCFRSFFHSNNFHLMLWFTFFKFHFVVEISLFRFLLCFAQKIVFE